MPDLHLRLHDRLSEISNQVDKQMPFNELLLGSNLAEQTAYLLIKQRIPVIRQNLDYLAVAETIYLTYKDAPILKRDELVMQMDSLRLTGEQMGQVINFRTNGFNSAIRDIEALEKKLASLMKARLATATAAAPIAAATAAAPAASTLGSNGIFSGKSASDRKDEKAAQPVTSLK